MAGGRLPLRPGVPGSFQVRLTIAFGAIVGFTLLLVVPVVVNRLDDYFRQQEEQGLGARAEASANVLDQVIRRTVGDDAVVLEIDGEPALNPRVAALLVQGGLLQVVADNVAQADVRLRFGFARPDTDGRLVVLPEQELEFAATLQGTATRGQARDPAIRTVVGSVAVRNVIADWGMELALANPYTSRASTLGAITGLLAVLGGAAFLIAIFAAAFLAHRFSVPLTRLTDAARRLAEGDLGSRVPADEYAAGTRELQDLSTQFNTMADRLEESVTIIRRDRDRSREFLADVSHELRTPIAATRTFIELLQGPAGTDPGARGEFLESSAVQLDRLDWLAQNLLELSKLDSGLVLLDLRPDDLRGTVEAAVAQARPAAERKGVALELRLPDRPLRIHHDGHRIGQVVANLVGNAVKFTPGGGRVEVTAAGTAEDGARIEVADTGAGIRPDELPRIFERFYRGSSVHRARGTGSGLGLAIVKSIVDIHHGTIEVESRPGEGSRFWVTLPRDPREAEDPPGPAAAPKMVDSSPGDARG